MTDNHKVAFILSATNPLYYEESVWYIDQLRIPDGYEKDIICITGAESMAEAYNAALESSDAKYKIYMHQDVFIYHKGFIEDILRLFKAHDRLGLMGMIGGVALPRDAVTWNAWNRGCAFGCTNRYAFPIKYHQDKELTKVEAVDGMLMATQYDIPWREDLDLGWDYYDISQSLEFRRNGYDVGIPYQRIPWSMHDCGYSKLEKYDLARKNILEEYNDFFSGKYVAFGEDERITTQKQIFDKMYYGFEAGALDFVLQIREMIGEGAIRNNDLQYAMNLADIYKAEGLNVWEKGSFFYGICSYEELKEKYDRIKFVIRHIENGTAPERTEGLRKQIEDRILSREAVWSIAGHSAVIKDKVRVWLS